ncbi:MAG: hypothetical protein CL780_01185 [Chloroflexi bacterium]|nr:hypothetical protein [Chloroflexota bacterium]
METTKKSFSGVHFMLPTPFNDNGKVDYKSLGNLVELSVNSGCSGVVTLGVMGEANRMLDSERTSVLEFLNKAMNNRLPITVGVSSESNFVLQSRIIESQDLGASAFLICPPRMNKLNEITLLDYFRTAQESSEIPIVLQDLPSESGIFLNPEIIKKLKTEFPLIEMLKLEDPPTPQKISKILETIPDILIFGGLGGAFFLEELQRGASGTMTGFAYPEVLTSIYQNVKVQNLDKAINTFYKWLPLIRYENSVGIGLSIRKNVLKHRNFIKSSNVRKPTPEIDTETLEELKSLLSTMKLDEDSENFSL